MTSLLAGLARTTPPSNFSDISPVVASIFCDHSSAERYDVSSAANSFIGFFGMLELVKLTTKQVERKPRWHLAIAATLWPAACLTPRLPSQSDKTAHSLKQPLPSSFVGDWDLFDCTPYGAPADAGKHANAHRRCRLMESTIRCVQDWDGCHVHEHDAKVWSENGQGFVDWSGNRLEGCEPKGCTPVARQTDGVSYPVLCEGRYDLHQDPIMKLSVANDVLVLGDDEVGCKFRRVTSSPGELLQQPKTPHESDAGHVLSAEDIRSVVLANLTPMHRCYESEAARSPNWASEITLVFQIATTGNVTDVRVKRSASGSPRFDACVVEAARHLRFPSSVHSSSVEWPFKFGPHASPNDGGRVSLVCGRTASVLPVCIVAVATIGESDAVSTGIVAPSRGGQRRTPP